MEIYSLFRLIFGIVILISIPFVYFYDKRKNHINGLQFFTIVLLIIFGISNILLALN